MSMDTLTLKEFVAQFGHHPDARLILGLDTTSFMTCWNDSWRLEFEEMVEEWVDIEPVVLMVYGLAIQLKLEKAFFQNFYEQLSLYCQQTRVYMHDFEGKGAWKLERIQKIMQEIQENHLS